MRFPGIANFDFRNIARAAERFRASVRHRENHNEVIDAIELSFHFLTVLKTDAAVTGRVSAASTTAAIQEF